MHVYGTDGVAILDPERASWTPGTPLPSTSAAEADGGFGGRIYHGAALLRHGLVLITGGNGAKITFIPAATGTPAKFRYLHSLVRRTGLTYDPGSDTWTRTPKLDMLSTRAGHELVRQVDGNAILAIGGRYLDNTALTQPLTEALIPGLRRGRRSQPSRLSRLRSQDSVHCPPRSSRISPSALAQCSTTDGSCPSPAMTPPTRRSGLRLPKSSFLELVTKSARSPEPLVG